MPGKKAYGGGHLALLLTSCVTYSKSLCLSEPYVFIFYWVKCLLRSTRVKVLQNDQHILLISTWSEKVGGKWSHSYNKYLFVTTAKKGTLQSSEGVPKIKKTTSGCADCWCRGIVKPYKRAIHMEKFPVHGHFQ